MAASGATAFGLFGPQAPLALALAKRLCQHYPALSIHLDTNEPTRFDLVVNATPVDRYDRNPMPLGESRIAREAFGGEVVMKQPVTALLQAAQARGCSFQIGPDMLLEQISACLELFDLPTTTPEKLRAVAQLAMCCWCKKSEREGGTLALAVDVATHPTRRSLA